MYDCLIVEIGLDDNGKTILTCNSYSCRIGFFFVRDIWKYCHQRWKSSENPTKKIVSEEDEPGLRMSLPTVYTYACLLLFALYSFALALGSTSSKCTKLSHPEKTVNSAIARACIFGFLLLIYLCWKFYQHCKMDSPSKVAYKYSNYFFRKRFQYSFDQRCPIDILTIVFSPIVMIAGCFMFCRCFFIQRISWTILSPILRVLENPIEIVPDENYSKRDNI